MEISPIYLEQSDCEWGRFTQNDFTKINKNIIEFQDEILTQTYKPNNYCCNENRRQTSEVTTEINSCIQKSLGITLDGPDNESILSEQLCNYFEENMKLAKQLNLFRDENLELKCELIELKNDYELVQTNINKCQLKGNTTLEKDYEQPTNIQKCCNAEWGLNDLKCILDDLITDKTMDTDHRLAVQKMHYVKIIDELYDELTLLSKQIEVSQKDSLKQEDLTNRTGLEKLLRDMEYQNDSLQTAVEDYEQKMLKSNQQVEYLTKENEQLRLELNENQKIVHECRKQNDFFFLNLNQFDSKSNTDSNSIDSKGSYELIEALNYKIQMIQKHSIEESSRLSYKINDQILQIDKQKLLISNLELTLGRKNSEISQIKNQLEYNEKKVRDIERELYSKTNRLNQTEQEEYKLRKNVHELLIELSDIRKDQRKRESNIISDLNLSRQVIEDQKKILSKKEIVEGEKEQIKQGLEAISKENYYLKNENAEMKQKLVEYEKIDEQLTLEKCAVNRLKDVEVHLNSCQEQNKKLILQNSEIVTNYQNLQFEYEELREEYKKLLDVKEHALNAIDTARKWQSENSEREKWINMKLLECNDHIKKLLDDRINLIEKIQEMHRDEIILRSELDRIKENSKNESNYSSTLNNNPSKFQKYSSDPEINDVFDPIFSKVKSVTRKLLKTRRYFQDGISEAVK